MSIPSNPPADAVAALRAFNRFWTTQTDLLSGKLLDTAFNLSEARILFELAQTDRLDLATLLQILRVDPGYVSRLLKRLADRGLITASPAPDDARRRILTLTRIGRDAFADLDHRSDMQAEDILRGLSPTAIAHLTQAMTFIQSTLTSLSLSPGMSPPTPGTPRPCLSPPTPFPVMSSEVETSPPSDPASPPPVLSVFPPPRRSVALRDLLPGDLGWVVARHGALYAAEYSWDMSFEALVAHIVADFAALHDPSRERAWIADLDVPALAGPDAEHTPAGCIVCVQNADDPATAQLRLLLVEPAARGLGVGSALVRACLDFARAAGYTRIVLWTNDVLTAARRIYEREGFTLISSDPHTSFGHPLIGQYWARDL